MNYFLQNIIPRLKEYSDLLDKKEVFVDKSWILIDGNSNLQRFIFKRNGELIMSLKGDVTIGRWEYLSEVKSLLIDRLTDKILLNQDFINQAVMLLRKDGETEYFILANDSILKNLDVETYLKKFYRQKNNISTIELDTGKELELIGNNIATIGTSVTIDGLQADTNIYENKNGAIKYYVEKGILIKIIERTIYNSKKGEIIVEKQRNFLPLKGDMVFQDDLPAEGKFYIEPLHYIHVRNGIIERTTYF